MSNKLQQHVRFGSTTVRTYPMILGDHPGGVSTGPPLTLDWEHLEEITFDLNEYERKKQQRDLACDPYLIGGTSFWFTPGQRYRILRRAGYDRLTIDAAVFRVLIDRENRAQSIPMWGRFTKLANESMLLPWWARRQQKQRLPSGPRLVTQYSTRRRKGNVDTNYLCRRVARIDC